MQFVRRNNMTTMLWKCFTFWLSGFFNEADVVPSDSRSSGLFRSHKSILIFYSLTHMFTHNLIPFDYWVTPTQPHRWPPHSPDLKTNSGEAERRGLNVWKHEPEGKDSRLAAAGMLLFCIHAGCAILLWFVFPSCRELQPRGKCGRGDVLTHSSLTDAWTQLRPSCQWENGASEEMKQLQEVAFYKNKTTLKKGENVLFL